MPQIDYNLVTLAVGTGTLILLLVELRSNHTWNQKRTSYELLNDMITSAGMTDAMEQLHTKAGWDILAGSENYDDVVMRLKPGSAEIRDVNQQLIVILRYLEMVCISISHGIVSERIAWEGFFGYFERVYSSSLPFIEKERIRRENAHVYENFERFALKWRKKPRR
jgi:hypothetical protein